MKEGDSTFPALREGGSVGRSVGRAFGQIKIKYRNKGGAAAASSGIALGGRLCEFCVALGVFLNVPILLTRAAERRFRRLPRQLRRLWIWSYGG